jgi:hypothetical protein
MTSQERIAWAIALAIVLGVQYLDKELLEASRKDLSICTTEMIKREGDENAYKQAISYLLDRIGAIVEK